MCLARMMQVRDMLVGHVAVQCVAKVQSLMLGKVRRDQLGGDAEWAIQKATEALAGVKTVLAASPLERFG